jgi:hypothetical protein
MLSNAAHYSAEVPLCSNITPERSDTFIPFWHEFKNSIMVKNWLLQSQPFKNSHFYFLIIVELATCLPFLQRPKLQYKLLHLTEMAHWSNF